MSLAQKMAYSVGIFGVTIVVAASTSFGFAAPAEATTVVQAPTCTMSISPSSVYSGDSAILSWSSQNANLAVIDQGVGSVTSSGSQTISNLTSSKTYTMTVNGPGGSAACVAAVGVLPRENQLPTCSISANPAYLTQSGATVLTWSSTNAQNASINQSVGIVSPNGTYTVNPPQGVTVYTLTVNGNSGSNTCSTTVTNNYSYYNPGYYQQPYCTISVTPSYTQYGQYANLTWNAYGTDVYGPYIDNGVGSVTLSGTRVVNPNQTTTYRMTISDRQGRTNSCQTTLTVGGSNYYPNYNQPAYYNYIPLRHIPYTGTEDTLFMVFVVLVTIGAWSTAGYMLYNRRDQIAALLK